MMKLISTLSVYSCFLVFIGLTACGEDESATGETSSTTPSSSDETTPTNPSSSGEPSSTTGALAAPGSTCSCDDDCVSVEGHTGVCLSGICMLNTIPFNTCDDGGTNINPNNLNNPNCPTGFGCGELEVPTQDDFYLCFPPCNDVNCHGQCIEGIACIPTEETSPQCDNECSLYCGMFNI